MFIKRILQHYLVAWLIMSVPKKAATIGKIDLKKKEGETIFIFLQKEDYHVIL